jgi:4-diphosphocytidyl-2-C-methyl-D-erythritol kinase
MITLNAYAKLNLALAVTGIRQDGYHELDTVMQSISLFDIVSIEEADGITVQMDADWADEKNNTAYKAAQSFFEYTALGGASISITKRIPRMAGLGGASADAAAVLIGLDRLYETRLAPEILRRLGASVGADVPFALSGGLARARGIGEKLTFLKPIKPMYYSIVKPSAGVSTAGAFKKYSGSGPISIDTVEYAAVKGDVPLFLRSSENALSMAALSLAPDILKAAAALKEAGAKKAFMTGSGSAVFSTFETEREAAEAAERVCGDFELCGAFKPVGCGAEITGES